MASLSTLIWLDLRTRDLPAVGSRVLLCDMRSNPPDVTVAQHLLDKDGEPPETYWQDEHNGGQQWAIYEKWTHWAFLNLPEV